MFSEEYLITNNKGQNIFMTAFRVDKKIMPQLHITHLFLSNCLMTGCSYLSCPASAVAPSSIHLAGVHPGSIYPGGIHPGGGQSLLFKVFASSRVSCFSQTLIDPERRNTY